MSVNENVFPTDTVADYQTIRSSIESGDILLCSGSAWFSKMIQHATDSIWSHVAFVMRLDLIDRIMVLESVEPIGVRTVPLSKYLNDYDNNGHAYPGGLVLLRHSQFDQTATPDKLKELGQFAVDLFGYPYDKEEIAKIAARVTAEKLGFTSDEKKQLERNKEYICSEYVWECYNSLGIEIEYDPAGFVSPADIAASEPMNLTYVLKRP